MNLCTCCTTCKKKSNGYIRNMKGTKLNTSKYHYLLVALTLAAVSIFFVHDVAEEGQKFIYHMPQKTDFTRKPSFFISTLEFAQEDVRESKQNMAYQMDYSCEASVNDVIFSFQYVRSTITNESYNDHIFMICSNHMVFGNSEIVYESAEKILCTEEYAGTLHKKVRSQNITIKGIDIRTWMPVEYSSHSFQESCTIAHAVEMLNNEWA